MARTGSMRESITRRSAALDAGAAAIKSAAREQRSQLDEICWWLFPLSYGIFVTVMVALWSGYPHLNHCDYPGFTLNSTRHWTA